MSNKETLLNLILLIIFCFCCVCVVWIIKNVKSDKNTPFDVYRIEGSGIHVEKNMEKCEYRTPLELYKDLDDEFHFTLDVAATKENAKCKTFFTKNENGLLQPWKGCVWMNPPYGREVKHWVAKAFRSRNVCDVIVGLLPASTGTQWFHSYIYRKAAVRFLKGRLSFKGDREQTGQAPFNSMVVIWRPWYYKSHHQLNMFTGGTRGKYR